MVARPGRGLCQEHADRGAAEHSWRLCPPSGVRPGRRSTRVGGRKPCMAVRSPARCLDRRRVGVTEHARSEDVSRVVSGREPQHSRRRERRRNRRRGALRPTHVDAHRIFQVPVRRGRSDAERPSNTAAGARWADRVVDLKVGANVVGSARSYDTGLVVSFKDRAALDSYQTDARHVPVAQFGVGLCDHIVAVDFKVG